MFLQPVLIAGKWQEAKDKTKVFNMTNPANKSRLPESYPVSTKEEVLEALEAGKKAADELRTFSPEKIAEFLELFAKKIEERTEELPCV